MRVPSLTVPAIALLCWGATALVSCGGISTVSSPDGGGGVSGSAGLEGGTSGSSDAGNDLASDSVSATDAGSDSSGGGGTAADGGSADSVADAADSSDSAGTAGSSTGTAGSSAGAAGSSAGTAGSSAGTTGSSVDASADAVDSAGAGGTTGVVTSCVQQTDGIACDDSDRCTAQSSCSGGTCLGATPNETLTAHQLTLACPTTETAVNGMVNHTCDFPDTLAPNNIYTGNVVLVSHLDRIFANSDINPLGDGRIQLMCFYKNADGTGVGSISRLVVATSCTATSDAGFTCAR
jgi:hypothetical protein